MRATPHSDDNSLSVHTLQQIDEMCLEFESVWRSGQQPVIEVYVADW